MKRFASALSQKEDVFDAVEEAALAAREALAGKPCDLAVFFLSEPYGDIRSAELIARFRDLAAPRFLLGCNACGVIGDRKEVEMKPAVSCLMMHLPGVEILPFSITSVELERFQSAQDLVEHLDVYPTEGPKFMCLADPATCDVSRLVDYFNEAYPNIPVVGGLASSNVSGYPAWLALGGEVFPEGSVGLVLKGPVEFDIMVSQGCRPIGEPLAITKADQNILYELAGKSAIPVLQELFAKLSPEDQTLAQNSLFVGLAMDEKRSQYACGDFLIRNIIGADQKSGALAIGALLEVGQTLQFQLRDAHTSEQDLRAMLERFAQGKRARADSVEPPLAACTSRPEPPARAEGALLVSCCGRGRNLFGEEDHDIRLIQSLRGPLPIAGFFANGEFGPIERKNYVHGYTSSLTILR